MDWAMNNGNIGKLALDTSNTSFAAMRRTIIDDPENSAGIPIRPLHHDLVDQTVECNDAGLGFAGAKHLRVVYIKSSHICPSAKAFVFMLDFHGQVRSSRQCCMDTPTSLDTVFFVCRNDKFVLFKRGVIPNSLVQGKYPRCFFFEVRIAGKNPASMLPWPDGIFVKPSPHGAPANRRNKACALGTQCNVSSAQPRERQIESGRQFTSKCFNLNDQIRGEKTSVSRSETRHLIPPNVCGKSAFAIWIRFLFGCKDEWRFHRFPILRQQEESFLLEQQKNTVTYILSPF